MNKKFVGLAPPFPKVEKVEKVEKNIYSILIKDVRFI